MLVDFTERYKQKFEDSQAVKEKGDVKCSEKELIEIV